MKIEVGVSARHIHLNLEDYKLLFDNLEMEVVKSLKQPNQFASNLFLDIETDKNIIKKVRVIGPLRDYTQVEISKTDAVKLGINPPIRTSGDIIGGAILTIQSGNSKIKKECAIIPNRHIHLTKEDIDKLNLNNTSKVSVKVLGEKGGILDNVYLKESSNAYFELHLDTDDANSHLINNGDIVEIITQ